MHSVWRSVLRTAWSAQAGSSGQVADARGMGWLQSGWVGFVDVCDRFERICLSHLFRLSRRLRLLGVGGVLCLSACGPASPDTYAGYIEGEWLYLAAPQAGYLQTLDAYRGSRVGQGQQVFSVSAEPDVQAAAEAEARVDAAQSRLQNLQTGRRAPEIAALEANVRAAEAAARLAHSQLQQQEALARQQFISGARLDEARSAEAQAQAHLQAAREQWASARLTLGRPAERQGALADAKAAAAQLEQKRWQLAHKTVLAPVAGEVSDTYYRPGEWVAAGMPVASLLPDTQRRLRFFVPETAVALLHPGLRVEARCDGCSAPVRGTVNFVAAQAEYTPPVIYSRGSREKLVFRVEAVPDAAQAATLRPGLPIDVRVLAGQETH